MYLYRLEISNPSQAVSSSAGTLMVPTERQLCVVERKSWALLKQRNLVTAARDADEGGNSYTAACLYTEALYTTLVFLQDH